MLLLLLLLFVVGSVTLPCDKSDGANSRKYSLPGSLVLGKIRYYFVKAAQSSRLVTLRTLFAATSLEAKFITREGNVYRIEIFIARCHQEGFARIISFLSAKFDEHDIYNSQRCCLCATLIRKSRFSSCATLVLYIRHRRRLSILLAFYTKKICICTNNDTAQTTYE